jgi:chaperonin GroES
MTADTVQPLGSRVLLRILDEASVTASGLVIPDTAREKGQRAEVVATGDDDTIPVTVGDRVLFSRYAGTELRIDGADHLIAEAGDILAVLRPAAVTV